ncbi:MAG: hypothetical protein QM504_13550 [Pseudomonadota bacterium]
MKTITTTLLIAAATAFSINVSAGVNNMNQNSFLNETVEDEYKYGESTFAQNTVSMLGGSILNEVSFLNETVEDEYNYIDPVSEQNIASVLSELDSNPPAAGRYSSNEISFLNETVEDEHRH